MSDKETNVKFQPLSPEESVNVRTDSRQIMEFRADGRLRAVGNGSEIVLLGSAEEQTETELLIRSAMARVAGERH